MNKEQQQAMMDQINWCTKVVRNLELGEVIMDIDYHTPRFYIRRKGMITHRFNNLQSFTRFVERSVEYKSRYRHVGVRSVRPMACYVS